MTDTPKSLDALQEVYEAALIALDDNARAAAWYQHRTIDECEAAFSADPEPGNAPSPALAASLGLALDALRAERDFLAASLAAGIHLDGHDRQRAIHHGLIEQ